MNVVDKSRTVSHYAAMAAEARRTTERRGAHADAVATAKADLGHTFARAVFEDPRRAVPTPGYSYGAETREERMRLSAKPAVDVVFDDLDGASSESAEMREAMVRVVALAARRGDLLAQLLVTTLAARFANFHAADKVAEDDAL